MYIPEFWCGVVVTLVVEVVAVIAYAVYSDHKKGEKKGE